MKLDFENKTEFRARSEIFPTVRARVQVNGVTGGRERDLNDARRGLCLPFDSEVASWSY
jgi:hypothetical protein